VIFVDDIYCSGFLRGELKAIMMVQAHESSPRVKFGCLNCLTAGALCSEMYLTEFPAVMLYAKGSWLPSQGVNIASDRKGIAQVVADLHHTHQHNQHDEL